MSLYLSNYWGKFLQKSYGDAPKGVVWLEIKISNMYPKKRFWVNWTYISFNLRFYVLYCSFYCYIGWNIGVFPFLTTSEAPGQKPGGKERLTFHVNSSFKPIRWGEFEKKVPFFPVKIFSTDLWFWGITKEILGITIGCSSLEPSLNLLQIQNGGHI